MACGILEDKFANKLRNRLRQGYPAGYLDIAGYLDLHKHTALSKQVYSMVVANFGHGIRSPYILRKT